MKYGIIIAVCVLMPQFVAAESGVVHGYQYDNAQVNSDSTIHRYRIWNSLPEIRGDIKVAIPYDGNQSVECKIKIIKPNPAIDYKILIKKPDPNIDYKIMIKNPFKFHRTEHQ